MFKELKSNGWDIYSNHYAENLLHDKFPEFCKSFESALIQHYIPAAEIIGGGGGMHKQTQRLGSKFYKINLGKANLISSQTTYDKKSGAIIHENTDEASHEIDHMYISDQGNIGIEIEWNTKPVSFDRDLDNFRRLYAKNAIDVGIIITRGRDLNDNLYTFIESFFKKLCSNNMESDIEKISLYLNKMGEKYEGPTKIQMKKIKKLMENGYEQHTALAKIFHRDKYSSSTTHWVSLLERINRGGFRGIPLLFLGIPKNYVKDFD